MPIMSASFVRNQLRRLQSVAGDEPITTERKVQDFMGTLLQKLQPGDFLVSETYFPGFKAAMVSPIEPDMDGVVLYLHGGGYCCGDLDYAKGFATVLAKSANARIFCPAYRLAPEYPFPAALMDAVDSYRYLIRTFPAEKLVVIGESAGGGLLFSLCAEIKRLGLPMPAGLIAVSPWTDLTLSGDSYTDNVGVDPSLTIEHVKKFVTLYARDKYSDPLVSPLFADVSGFPETMLYAGGDEILRDDAVRMHEKLLAAGCKSRLVVAEEMWHAYILYGLKERAEDMAEISEFIRRLAK